MCVSEDAMSFIAKYRGTCGQCEGAIWPGDEVTWPMDGDIQHVRCEPQPDDQIGTRPADVCTTCWLTKPCECDT